MTEQFDSEEQSNSETESIDKKPQIKQKKNQIKNKGKLIINISDCQYPVVSRVAKGFGWKLQSSSQASDWDVCWTDNAVQPQTLSRMQPHQKINHFPGMFNLARKNLMGRYLMKMRKKFPEHYAFFPLTWMLPVQYHQLKAYFDSKPKGKARTFIVKPEALSQGKGIFLTRKLQEIDQNAHCVVQRYLHRPYLIEGLKFDLRVYVLVASVDPLRLYIYNQGLTRFATQKYQPPTKDNMEDVCMHLTNYAINKDNPKFVFNNSTTDLSTGHKRSLTWLFQYLEKNDPRGTNLKQKIEEMIVKTMISGLPAISNTYRSCQPENYSSNMCFELLGFDVMLTDKCQPVLLQINHTPSFTTDTPLDNLIKTHYIRDSLTLMNISLKNKQTIMKQRRQACQQRVITGKKIKLTNQQKQMQKKKAHEQREVFQSKNLGGFKKIFPIDDPKKMEQYDQFLLFSTEGFLISTGTKKSNSINKRTEKIQTAFGTCFTKKTNPSPKPLTTKNRGIQFIKYTDSFQRKYDTKKNITESVLQKQAKKLTHSQNLISPKSAISDKNQELNSPKREQSWQQQRHFSHDANLRQALFQRKQVDSMKKFFDQDQNIECIPLQHRSMKQAKSQPLHSGHSFKKGYQQKTKIDMITQKQQQHGCFQTLNQKVDCNPSLKNQNSKGRQLNINYHQRLNSSGRQKQLYKNVNNIEIFFQTDSASSTYGSKRVQKQSLTLFNPNFNNKNEQPNFGVFGVNQITIDGERNKHKNPSHPKYSRKPRLISNRQKIPILLNTLLIGNSESNPAVSAQNLRKILTKESK